MITFCLKTYFNKRSLKINRTENDKNLDRLYNNLLNAIEEFSELAQTGKIKIPKIKDIQTKKEK